MSSEQLLVEEVGGRCDDVGALGCVGLLLTPGQFVALGLAVSAMDRSTVDQPQMVERLPMAFDARRATRGPGASCVVRWGAI